MLNHQQHNEGHWISPSKKPGRAPFYRLVMEITQQHLVHWHGPIFRVGALTALQEAAEYYLLG